MLHLVSCSLKRIRFVPLLFTKTLLLEVVVGDAEEVVKMRRVPRIFVRSSRRVVEKRSDVCKRQPRKLKKTRKDEKFHKDFFISLLSFDVFFFFVSTPPLLSHKKKIHAHTLYIVEKR